jgi:hypothetical protein
LKTRLYTEQTAGWPRSGRHILARFDAETICVYQAYRASIADYAVERQRFGGDFSYSRMSWIKPNFLWMMFRSGWATKEGQERILSIRLVRTFFDHLLRSAVASTFDPTRHATQAQWREALDTSDVRLQSDPDHDPSGSPIERRAVQLGLRGETLRRYGGSEIVAIEDVTAFVAEQRERAQREIERLVTPEEQVYRPESLAGLAVGIDVCPDENPAMSPGDATD